MNFSPDSLAEIEGLLEVNRDFCKMEMTEKAPPALPLNCAVLPKLYGNDLILFEHLNAPSVQNGGGDVPPMPDPDPSHTYKTHVEKVAASSAKMRALYDDVCNYIETLGDMTSNQLKYYLAYKKTQNFACIEIYKDKIMLFLKLSPDSVTLEEGFTRDMRGVGHYGTGDLQVIIQNSSDLEKAKPLLEKAYQEV